MADGLVGELVDVRELFYFFVQIGVFETVGGNGKEVFLDEVNVVESEGELIAGGDDQLRHLGGIREGGEEGLHDLRRQGIEGEIAGGGVG